MSTSTPTRSRTRIRRWTYADYCRIPPDRLRHEIIDGRHFVTPSPGVGHQTASIRLGFELLRLIEKKRLGRVFAAPLDIHLGRGTVVQPDLVVIADPNSAIIGNKKVTGAPDLLVEILSPSTKSRDRLVKLRRYERAGVREYWIVDTDARLVEQHVLHTGKYGQPTVSGSRIRLGILRDVVVDLHKVW